MKNKSAYLPAIALATIPVSTSASLAALFTL
jgi:hypothetical protein